MTSRYDLTCQKQVREEKVDAPSVLHNNVKVAMSRFKDVAV
jgi:hypothetical protein